MSYPVTLIPGDGIGPEVADATRRVVDATGVKINWHRVELTSHIIENSGQVLPDYVVDSLANTRVGLKGPVTTPVASGFPSVNVALRKRMDLYANVRPIRTMPGVKTRYSDVHIDMVIFRENTEDVYSGLEHEIVPDVMQSLKIITRAHRSESPSQHFGMPSGTAAKSHGHSQSQHHEAERRTVPPLLPRSGRTKSERSNTRN